MATKIDEPASLQLRPRFLAAIGEVAVEWARLELQINSMIWVFAMTDVDNGAAVTSQITNIIARMAAVKALLEANKASKKTVERIEKFVRKLHGLSGDRNRIIHDPWMRGLKTRRHIRLEIDTRKGFRFEHKAIPLKEIKACAVNLREAALELARIHQDVILKDATFLSTWFEKSARQASALHPDRSQQSEPPKT